MKKNSNSNFISIKILFLSISIMCYSCDEKKFLQEIPLDFYAPENSYVTHAHFESALMNIYDTIRCVFHERYQDFPNLAYGMTEIAYPQPDYAPDYNMAAQLLPANKSFVYNKLWKPLYRIIYDANVIIGRVASDVSELTVEEQDRVKAEALFFRAFAHKILANVYGGVPIVLEETSAPKRDYVRASRKAVYEQCAEDLEFAVTKLPGIAERSDVTRINRLTAYHVLAEIYVSLERWQDAINTASIVIDDPGTGLMMKRFGTRVDDPNFGGNVYWDLFRKGNQSRSVGNTESLWVIPQRFMVAGGGNGGPGVRQIPRLWQLTVQNNDGKRVNLIPNPNQDYYGRGGGMSKPSKYLHTTVWQKSGYDQDIRNSVHNIVRDFQVRNPASDHNGKWLLKDNLPYAKTSMNDTIRDYYPVIAKQTTPGNHPKEEFLANPVFPGDLTSNATFEWKDRYHYRLAETYLLRAEAYLGNNDLDRAAEDINTVRRRAQAPDINPSDVDIDYILDERIRELHYEELYLFTTARLGKTVERTRKYHPNIGKHYQDHHNLWPIPYSEIEKNVEAVLEQNPGYN